MTTAEAQTAVRLAILTGPDSVRGPECSALDVLIVAREIHRRGLPMPNGTEEFLAGCLRRRSGRLTPGIARDLIVLAVDYVGKRITV